MKFKIAFLIFILFSFKKAAPHYLKEIKSVQDFKILSSEPLTNKYSDVTSVKVIYDLETKELYFANSMYYKFHYEFCEANIEPDLYLGRFNVDNYAADSPDRRYLLCNINYFKHLNEYGVELSPSDYMPQNQIELMMAEIKKVVFFGENLRLMLSTERLQSLSLKFSKTFKLLTPEEIYKSMKVQAVSEGKAIGNLRFVDDLTNEVNTLKRTDIIVIRETPLVLPHVAGIIVAEFQTPLSHLTILGRNRKVPVLALKNVFENEELKALEGKNVLLNVFPTFYKLYETTESSDNEDKNKPKIKLTCDLEIKDLVSVSYYKRDLSDYIGNKASNFSLLHALSKNGKFKVPEASFAIPFSRYNLHAHQSGAQKLIDALLLNEGQFDHQDSLKVKLKAIRKAIKSTEIDPSLLSLVEDRIKSNGGFTKMRFRSSTNAEDAKGFSGAGLYASKTGIIGDEKKSVSEAILKVWASLWSYEAFMEREYFNIDQSYVQMGILVHRAFPEEEVNGVIITKNLYRPGYLGFIVNAQLGNESVVQPRKGVTCDQFICYPETNVNIQPLETVIDVITLSSLNKGKLTMSAEEIQHLADEVYELKMSLYRRFGRRFVFEDYALDIEFKLEKGTRDLYIKQVRLYND